MNRCVFCQKMSKVRGYDGIFLLGMFHLPEGEVESLFRHRDRPDLCVDDNLRILRKSSLVSSNSVDQNVRIRLPRRRLPSSGVEFVVKQRERFFAGTGRPWVERTVSYRKLHLDVDSLRRPAFDERRPQPVVDFLERQVADDVRSPVDSFLEVCVAFFHPLKNQTIER